ncbi:Glutamyl-tRNA(Gln) amidotransferase subunit A [Variovorax sp. PBL-E5]|nr:Glutamyl-tRNA(Gln) amidotransferase subunit A [Variovorax sp. PBL-E5]
MEADTARMNPTELVALSATALSTAIHARSVSCREVMRAYLAQIARFNPQVNALVSLQDPERLLAEADRYDEALRRGESMGWMHGFPQAPKDLAATAGIPTTMGFRALAQHVPPHDAWVVERMRRAGAIFVGKSNTPEFGLGSHTYNGVFGATRNAWDPARSAGGSSGGAAAALALRMLPVADGSDMMGSLRNPAGWQHIYGMRPSMGLVPHGPADELFFQQLGTEGPMGRTPQDVAMLLSVQAGPDPRAPLSQNGDPARFAAPLARDFAGTRIGWLGDYGGRLPMEAGVLSLCQASLRHFEDIGCTVEDARPDFDMERLWRSWLTLRSFLVAGRLRPVHADARQRALLKPEAIWEIEQGRHLDAQAVYRATCDRSAWYGALGRLFERYDYLVLPSAQVFPFDVGIAWPKDVGGCAMDTYHRWMEVVIGGTLAGLPVIAVPAGFNAEGLPMGLQIMGRPRADLEVLQIADAWHRAVPFADRRPPMLDAHGMHTGGSKDPA